MEKVYRVARTRVASYVVTLADSYCNGSKNVLAAAAAAALAAEGSSRG